LVKNQFLSNLLELDTRELAVFLRVFLYNLLVLFLLVEQVVFFLRFCHFVQLFDFFFLIESKTMLF